MKTIERVNIATQEIGTTEWRSVSLELRDDGSIRMFTHDIGETVLRTWGKDDYEFWLTIPAKAMSLLAFALLRGKENCHLWLATAPQDIPRLVFNLLLDRYAGNPEATDELRDFCQTEGVVHEWQSWP